MNAPNKDRSDKIIAWLKDHILISRHALCTMVDYDSASLYKVMDGTSKYVAIPAKHLDAIESILKEYGYQP